MTDPKPLADAIDPRVDEASATCDFRTGPSRATLIAASDLIRTLLSRIEELESAAALAGKIAIEEAAEAAQNATLPDGFQWGREAMGSFEFGKHRAAEAVRSLSKPIDRDALIERGARAAAAVIAKRHGDSVEYWMGEARREEARAILSAWIGEEKETK